MPENPNTPEWVRMEVKKDVVVGKFIVDITLHPEKTRPKNVGELKVALGDAANFYHVTDETPVDFIDTPIDRLKIRLPPKSMVEAAVAMFDDQFPLGRYPQPKYLSDLFGQSLTADQLFYARIGDYTTSECA